jgi:integrase
MNAFKIFAPDADAGPDNDTLAWFADKYRAHLAARVDVDDYSPRRLKGTMSYVDSFLRFLFQEDGPPLAIGRLAVKEAKQVHLTAWLTAHYKTWTKGSTRNDALGAVLGCFNWLEEQLYIEVSPFRRPRNLRFPRTHHRAMRKQHYRAVMREARKEEGRDSRTRRGAFRLIFFASWHAGVRLAEFRRLEPHEIDWECSVARLPPDKNKTGRKTGEGRIVALGPHLVSVLRGVVRRMQPGQKYVFLSPRGSPWGKDNLSRQYARYRTLALVPPAIKMCSVRHGCAVRLLLQGENSKAVADLLGHKGTRMVDSIYGAETRYDAESLREVAARAEKGKRKPSEPRKRQKPTGPRDTPLFDGLE